jgi:hypothetical protein
LSLECLFCLVKCLLVKLRHTQIKHFSGANLMGRLLASPTNSRPDKNLLGTNAKTDFTSSSVTEKVSLITLKFGAKVVNISLLLFSLQQNKLESLPPASLCSPVYCLLICSGAYLTQLLSYSPRKKQPGANALAYLPSSL